MPDAPVIPAADPNSADPFVQAAASGQPTTPAPEPPLAQPSTDASDDTLEGLRRNIAVGQVPPLDAAEAIRKWRDTAAPSLSSITDTTARWQAKDALDSGVDKALSEQKQRATQQWADQSFGSKDEAKAFTEQFAAAHGDPTKMSPQFQNLGQQLLVLDSVPQFQDTREQRNVAPGLIKSGDTTVGRYDYREGDDGNTSVLLRPTSTSTPDMPGYAAAAVNMSPPGAYVANKAYGMFNSSPKDLPPIPLSVKTPNANDIKAAADAATAQAASSRQTADTYQQYKDSGDPDWEVFDNGPSQQKARDDAAKALALHGPNAKAILTAERVKSAVAEPEFAGRVGQMNLGQDFVKGLVDSSFQAAGLPARAYDIATGGNRAVQSLADASEGLDAIGGSTRPGVTGDFIDQNLSQSVRGGAAMLPLMAASPIAGVLDSTVVKTGIGATGAAMGVNAAGSSQIQAQQRLSGLDQQKTDLVNKKIALLAKGDDAGAATADQDIQSLDQETARVKAGRDANSILTGALMGGVSAWSPLHNLGSSGNMVADVAKQALEMPAMTVGQKFIDNLTTGDPIDLTGKELGGAAAQGVANALLFGTMTRIANAGKAEANKQAAVGERAASMAQQTGSNSPETLGAIQALTAAKVHDVIAQTAEQIQQTAEEHAAAQSDMADHQAKVAAIMGAKTSDDIPEEAPLIDPTPNQQKLWDIRQEETRRQQLKLEMTKTAENPAMTDEEKQDAMKPLASELKQVEKKLVTMPIKLEGTHQALHQDISAVTEQSDEQSPQNTAGGHDNGQKEDDEENAQDDQGQEGGRRGEEDGQDDEVTVIPATAGAQGEPLPTRSNEENATPAAGDTATPESQAPDIREPWINNAVKLAGAGADQRGALVKNLNALTEPDRIEAAKRAGVANPALHSMDELADQMAQGARETRPPEPPPTPEAPNATKMSEAPDYSTVLDQAQIDADRKRLGLTPIMKSAPRSMQGHIDQAAKLGLQEARNVVDRLNADPKPPTPLEQAQMFLLKDHLERQLADASERFNKAADGSDSRASASQDVQSATDALTALHKAAFDSHSEWGRSGRMMQFMLDRDEVPPLPVMLAKLEISKGAPLTANEKAEVAADHKAWSGAKDEMDADQERQERNSMAQMVDDVVAEMEKDLPKGDAPKRPIRDALKARADAAREAIRKSSAGLSMLGAKDLENLPHYAVIMASHIADALGSVKDGVTRFVKEFPDKSKEFVKAALGQAQSLNAKIDERLKNVSEKAKGSVGATPDELIARAREATKPGDAVDPKVALGLMKALIREGVTDVHDLTDKLTSAIRQVYPEVTERDVRQAVTGYGKVDKPSADADAKKMADLRSQMLLIEKLTAAKNKEAILKTGPQRDRASEEVRALQRELNEHMRRSGYNSSGPDQVRGRLDAIKQGLRNQIEDLNAIIEGKRGVETKGLAVERDEETRRLEEIRDQLNRRLLDLPQHRDALNAAENARAIDAAKASRDEYNRRIREKEFDNQRNPSKQATQELRAMRAERDAAAQNFRDLKAGSDSGKAQALQSKIDAATKAVESKEQALRDNLKSGEKAEKVLASDPALKLLRERQAELNNELRTQRYGDGMDALKKWADNRRQELQDRLDGKPDEMGTKRPKPTGPEADAIRTEIADLKKQVDAKEAPDKARASIEKRIEKTRRDIDENNITRPKRQGAPEDPALKQRQDYLDLLQHVHDQMKRADGTLDNETYRKRLDSQVKRMEANEAAGFPKKSPRVIPLDAESEAKKAAVAKFRKGFEQRRYDAEQAKRTTWEKGWDKAVGATKFLKLLHPSTLLRLASITADRLAFLPAEEATSAIVSKLAPKMADLATIKGHGSLGSVGAFYGSFFKQGLGEGVHALKPIVSMLSLGRFGDIHATSSLKDSYETKPHSSPSVLDIPRMIHAAEKAPLMRAAFEQAKYKLAENASRTGKATSAEEIGKQAFIEAQRAVGMNENLVNSAISAGLNGLVRHGPDGRPTPMGVATQGLTEMTVPFRKPATNDFAKVFNRIFGVPVGAVRLGSAYARDSLARSEWTKSGSNPAQRVARFFAKEMESVHPDVANSIFRNLMEGSPGAAMILLGAATAASWGGLNYLKKRPDENTPDFGEIMVNGVKIPKAVSLGSTALTAAQFGATVAHMAMEKFKKKDKEPMGTGNAIGSTLLGLTKAGPFLPEMTRIASATEGQAGFAKFGGEWLKGNLIPGILNDYAVWSDQQNGVPVRRQINRWYDPVLSAIPGAREELKPVKTKGYQRR